MKNLSVDEIRSLLPARERALFDDIVYQRVLGASKHIQMIGQMFLAMADQAESRQDRPVRLWQELQAVADFFRRTRGEASRAVSNAINRMLLGMGDIEDGPLGDAVKGIHQSVECYRRQSEADMDQVVRYAAEAAKPMRKIMVFDYSSTVNAFLERLGEEQPGMEVFIPESRTINGGYAFVASAIKAGMKVHFIPDASIMYFLKACDGAFFGAETLYADGTVFNTTGSDVVGLVCKTFNVPLYVLTPMVKLDIRPVYGYNRELVINDLKKRLAGAGFLDEELRQVDFRCPELLPVEPEYIKGIITEFGIIPAQAVYPIALDYDRKLKSGEAEDE